MQKGTGAREGSVRQREKEEDRKNNHPSFLPSTITQALSQSPQAEEVISDCASKANM